MTYPTTFPNLEACLGKSGRGFVHAVRSKAVRARVDRQEMRALERAFTEMRVRPAMPVAEKRAAVWAAMTFAARDPSILRSRQWLDWVEAEYEHLGTWDLAFAPLAAGRIKTDSLLPRDGKNTKCTMLEFATHVGISDVPFDALCKDLGVESPRTYSQLRQISPGRKNWPDIPTWVGRLRTALVMDQADENNINLHLAVPGMPAPLTLFANTLEQWSSSTALVAILDDLFDAGVEPAASVWVRLHGRMSTLEAWMISSMRPRATQATLRLIERCPSAIEQVQDFEAKVLSTAERWRMFGSGNEANDLLSLVAIRRAMTNEAPRAPRKRASNIF